jgi:hypothetical protein
MALTISRVKASSVTGCPVSRLCSITWLFMVRAISGKSGTTKISAPQLQWKTGMVWLTVSQLASEVICEVLVFFGSLLIFCSPEVLFGYL